MKTIHKFPLLSADDQSIPMPEGSEILTAQMQNGKACLWALVDDARPMVQRLIHVRGTGHGSENLGRYISTIQMQGGSLIFHIFEGNASRESVSDAG